MTIDELQEKINAIKTIVADIIADGAAMSHPDIRSSVNNMVNVINNTLNTIKTQKDLNVFFNTNSNKVSDEVNSNPFTASLTARFK